MLLGVPANAPQTLCDKFVVVLFGILCLAPFGFLAVGGEFKQKGSRPETNCDTIAPTKSGVEPGGEGVDEVDRETDEGDPSRFSQCV